MITMHISKPLSNMLTRDRATVNV